MQENGCIVATDITQEWLLPWWWDHYAAHNSLPVTFVDLGMSQEQSKWCQERGHYVHPVLSDVFVLDKAELPKERAAAWEQEHGTHFWESRKAWFKKPLACLCSPYQRTLWLDLDCEVRGSLLPLFTLSTSKLMIGRETTTQGKEGVNSGVILFETSCSLMQRWAEEALQNSHYYVGDQDILTLFLQQDPSCMGILPPLYNWSRFHGENPEAIIMHWHGNHGKTVIAHQIARKNLALMGFA